MQVEHEVGQRALHMRERARQQHEARSGHLGRGLEIHQAQRLADVEVLTGLEIECRLVAPGADFLVCRLIGALGDVVGGPVGKLCHRLAQRRFGLGSHHFGLGLGVLGPRHLGDQVFGVLALGLERADLFRQLVALSLNFLGLEL